MLMSAREGHLWPCRRSMGSAVLAGPALCLAGQCRAHCRQFLLLLCVDLRVCEIELLHRFHDRSGDNKAGKPLVVGWHHEPWRVLRCSGADRFFVCAHVVAPELTLVHVRSRELPVLLRCIEAIHKPLFLFLARQLQEELEDNDSLPIKVILKVCDIGEPLVPYALADQRSGYLLLL